MLAATAAEQRARRRAANKLSPGEIAALLSGGWGVALRGSAHGRAHLHRLQDGNLWQQRRRKKVLFPRDMIIMTGKDGKCRKCPALSPTLLI